MTAPRSFFALVLVAMTGSAVAEPSQPMAQSPGGKLLADLEEANKDLPLDMGDSIRWDRLAGASDERRVIYYFTVTDHAADDVTTDHIRAKYPAQVQDACESETVRFLLNRGIAVTFEYATSGGAHFNSIEVTHDLCSSGAGI